jgi:mRNA interferase MazF
MEFNRGDLFWVDIDPTIGAEMQKIRPCVIVSNDIANKYSPLVTVVPLSTSTPKKIYLDMVFIPKDVTTDVDSYAYANQMKAVDKQRCKKYINHLPSNLIEALDKAIKIHLSLT